VRQLQNEQGALREAVTVSRSAEEACRAELAAVREDLLATQLKLREVTDHLDIDPDGPGHPNRRSGDPH
jgi:hypothetical protein